MKFTELEYLRKIIKVNGLVNCDEVELNLIEQIAIENDWQDVLFKIEDAKILKKLEHVPMNEKNKVKKISCESILDVDETCEKGTIVFVKNTRQFFKRTNRVYIGKKWTEIFAELRKR